MYGGSPTSQTTSRSAASCAGVMSKREQISSTVGPSLAATHGTMASSRCSRSADDDGPLMG